MEDRVQDLFFKDTWATEKAVLRLADYYYSQNRKGDLERVLNLLETSFNKAMEGVSSIQKANYFEQLYHLFKQFQLNSDAERLLLKLREMSKDTDKDLKTISSQIDIPKEKIDEYVDKIFIGDSEIIFSRIILAHKPSVKAEKAELINMSKQSPLYYLISKSLIDKKGRKIATIPPLNQDIDSHLVLKVSNSIRIGTIFLHFTFEEGIKREIFTIHEILKFLNKSCLIEKDRFFIIEKSLASYFSFDYLTFIHLIIPQFEEAIRNLVEINGGTVMVYKNEAFNLKTFDHLLNDQIVLDVFGEDLSLYFKVLFTDKRGWNLRNDVAHGMVESNHFNKQNADRVLHALLTLGMVRLKE